jgi:hypothetical protein
VEQAKYDAASRGIVAAGQVLTVAVHSATVAAAAVSTADEPTPARRLARAAFRAIVDESGWEVEPHHVYGNESDAGHATYLNLTDEAVVRRIVDRAVDGALLWIVDNGGGGGGNESASPLVHQLAELAASVAAASNARSEALLSEPGKVTASPTPSSLLTSSRHPRNRAVVHCAPAAAVDRHLDFSWRLLFAPCY